jgi:hypothetical protein
MGILQKISQIALTPSTAIGNVITAGLEKVTGKTYGRTTAAELSSTTAGKVLGTAIAGTAVALAATAAATIPIVATAAKSVGTKAVSVAKANPIKTAIAVPIITGAVISQPAAVAKAVVQTPVNLGNVGANIATLAADPSLENLKTLVVENPVIVGTGLAAGTALGLKGIAQTAATFSQTQATRDLTKTMGGIQVIDLGSGSGLPSSSIEEAQNTPLVQASTPIEETYQIAGTTKKATKRKKKKALEPRRQTISQRVNVNVGVDNRRVENKKYIKNTILIPA